MTVINMGAHDMHKVSACSRVLTLDASRNRVCGCERDVLIEEGVRSGREGKMPRRSGRGREKVTCKRMVTEDDDEGAVDDEGDEGALIV
jgi:hypothetical protein